MIITDELVAKVAYELEAYNGSGHTFEEVARFILELINEETEAASHPDGPR